MIKLPFTGVLLMVISSIAFGRTLHVSPGALPGVSANEQFRTISESVNAVKPGDTVLIYTGIYREAVVIEKSGTSDKPITFKSAPGARVVVTGADVPTQWHPEPGMNNVYSTDWPHLFIDWSKDFTHAAPAPIGRAEQVFVDGYPLQQVMDKSKLSMNTFYVDMPAKRLFVSVPVNSTDFKTYDVNNLLIEVSARGTAWLCKGDYINVKGIRFRYAASHAQQGLAEFKGNHSQVDDCVFEWSNGVGVAMSGSDITLRRCVIQEAGCEGFAASRTHNLKMIDCLCLDNNVKNFSRSWGGAGNKIALSHGVVIDRCRFIENRGFGLWFDIGNEECTVKNSLFLDNENGGLFYEISYTLRAHDNVFVRNGWDGTYGSWGAEAGITLSSSPGCVVERNLMIGNKEGFSFREQLRTTGKIGDEKTEHPVWNHDNVIRNNVMAYNDVQTWGWFAAEDERHWPAALNKKKQITSDKPEGDIAADYLAKDKSGQPVNLSLEMLNIVMRNNVYSPGTGGLFHWGPTWARNKQYKDIDSVKSELSLENGSVRCELDFVDIDALDLRLPESSPVFEMDCYPIGEVPGVKLGKLENTANVE